jgi:hypothetical protein
MAVELLMDAGTHLELSGSLQEHFFSAVLLM